MKILILNQVFYPDTAATAQHLTDLAAFLQGLGHEVSVLCSRQAYENPALKFSAFEEHRGVKIFRVSTLGLGKRNVLFRVLDSLWLELSMIIRLGAFPRQDWIFCFTSPPLIGFLGALRELFTREKLLQWLMDMNVETAQAVGILKKNGLAARVLGACTRFALRRATRIIVLDRQMKKKVEAMGIANPIQIIPPWLLKQVSFDKLPEINPLRKELNLENKFVVLYSGNHSLVHPLETVLQAALKLRDNLEIIFLFIGHGLRVSDVTQFKAKHRLENIVQLPLQPIEKLKFSLDLADVHIVVLGPQMSGLVHTSKIYGVLGTGKPFISVSEPDSHLTDLLATGYLGYCVAHDDPQDLVEAIEAVKKLSPEQRLKIRETNQTKLAQEWSRDAILSPLAKVL